MQNLYVYLRRGGAAFCIAAAKRTLLMILFCALFCPPFHAQLAYWDMQLDGVPPDPYLATRSSNLVAWAYAFAVPSSNSTGSPEACNGDAWSTAFWPSTTHRNVNEYIQFELTIASGMAANVTNFQFLSNLSSDNAAKNFDVYYSTNGFASESFLFSGSPGPGGCRPFSSDLDVSLFGGETIAFRIYFYNSNIAASAATTRLDNVQIFGSLLPVTLAYFEGEANGRSVLLRWETQTESNNDYMAVERSADGRHFTEIGRVAGAANSRHPRQYIFRDEAPWPGVNYYRLRQVDFDGTEEYHEVIAVHFHSPGKDKELRLFPTLVASTLEVRLNDGFSAPAVLEVVASDGHSCLRRSVPAGEKQLPIDVSALLPGLYWLRLFGGGEMASGRFIKR